MADVTNNSQRLIWMGNVMCIPGQMATVADTWITHPRYIELEANGDLTSGVAPPPLRAGQEQRPQEQRPPAQEQRPPQQRPEQRPPQAQLPAEQRPEPRPPQQQRPAQPPPATPRT